MKVKKNLIQSPPVVKIKFLMLFICLCGIFSMRFKSNHVQI